jgi:PPOX class probable FMN-dependent enzyme
VAQFVTTEAELEAIYGPHDTLVATIKEIDHISDHYRMFIDASPFVVVATSGPEGLDCSPRGDPRGFVRVVDRHTLLLPDRRGNNRIDALRNLVRDPRIALLFMIPGIGRTLRVNGRARIRVDEEIRESFVFERKLPRSVIQVTAERVYTQCPRALIRSRLWDPAQHLDESALPSHGTMMQAIRKSFAGEEWDRNYDQRLKETMY